MPGRSDLERSQRELFRQVNAELRLVAPPLSPGIRAYQKSFRSSLPKRGRGVSKGTLTRAAVKARVVLVGDFHPFPQSQKGFLRLLRDAIKTGERPAVALEFVPQTHQAVLDQFSRGLLTANELAEMIDYEDEWPFAWASYRAILDYARAERLPLIALNIKARGTDAAALRIRDEAAAARIAETVWSGGARRVFTLYGEWHLGRSHLPGYVRSALGPGARVLVVHQNEESLYWNAPRNSLGRRAEVLRLGKDEFCVLNSVPWVKARSYLDWLEGSGGDSWEEGPDTPALVLQFSRHLAELLSLDSSHLDRVEIWGPDAIDDLSSARGTAEEKLLQKHARRHLRVGLLATTGRLLVPGRSTNSLTEAAAIALWQSQLRTRPKAAAAYGPRLLVRFTIGYLGSKILNPKRKCNEVADMQAYLAHPSGSSKAKLLAFYRALALLSEPLGIRARRTPRLTGIAEIEATRLAGYVLGNRVFLAWQRDPSLRPLVTKLFRASTATDAWAENLLADIAKVIRRTRVSGEKKNAGF